MNETNGPDRLVKFESTYSIVTPDVDFIVITRDTLWVNAEKYLKNNNKEWIGWLSLSLTIALVIITADFKDVLLPATTWLAIFIIASAVTFIYSIARLIEWFMKRQTVDEFVEKCKCDKKQ